jgi:hypothetical protein
MHDDMFDGRAGGDEEDGGRALAAVVAHGLLSTAAVLAGAAHGLLHPERLTAEVREELIETLTDHAATFDEGLRVLVRHCSDAFGDAATTIALTAGTVRQLPDEDLPSVLHGIVDGIKILRIGLEALIRGLPPDVVSLLDSLQRQPR